MFYNRLNESATHYNLDIIRAPQDKDILSVTMRQHSKLCVLPQILHLQDPLGVLHQHTETTWNFLNISLHAGLFSHKHELPEGE